MQVSEFVATHRGEPYTLQFRLDTPSSGELLLFQAAKEPLESYAFQGIEEWEMTMRWVTKYFQFTDIASSSDDEGLRKTVMECPICLDALFSDKASVSCEQCSAKWHVACFDRWSEQSGNKKCPVCSVPID